MAVPRGIDIRSSGDRVLFRASLKNSAGSKLATGTTTLSIYELQDDGTFKTFDFADFTFKSGVVTTPTVNMTHRTVNNGGTNSGIWTYALTTVVNFVSGGIYIAQISNSGASPVDQEREFQYSDTEGDGVDVVKISGDGVAANNMEYFFDGTGDVQAVDLKARSLSLISNVGIGLDISSTLGFPGIRATGGTEGISARAIEANGVGIRAKASNLAGGIGIYAQGGNDANSAGVKADVGHASGLNFAGLWEMLLSLSAFSVVGSVGEKIKNLVSTVLGSRTITINVRDSITLLGIPDALVTIKDSNDLVIIDQKRTSASGQVIFALNDATYKVAVQAPPSHSSLSGQTLVVSANATQNYDLVSILPSAPVGPSMCTVQFYVYTPGGIPLSGATLEAELIKSNSAINNILISQQVLTGTTNGSGYGELQLIRLDQFVKGNGYYNIRVKDVSGELLAAKTVTIPNAASSNFEDLI